MLDFFKIRKHNIYNVDYISSTTNKKAVLGTIESDISWLLGKFELENIRGSKILDNLLKLPFNSVLDIGAGALQHSKYFWIIKKI